MSIIVAFSEFISFLKKPSYGYKSDQPIEFSTLTLMYMLIFFLIIFVSSPLMYLVGVENMQHSIDELMNNYPKWVFVLLTVVIAPVIEELIFRWHLRQPIILLYVITMLLCAGMSYAYQENLISLWPLIIILTFIISLFGLLMYSVDVRNSLVGFYKRYFPFVFYSTVIVFAFAHLSNFSDVEKWYIAPILVLPQALISLFLGYVRVRNNIFWSIYFHAFHNMIPTVIFLMMPEMM